MKRMLFAVAVAGFLTACNNDGAGNETVKDSVLEAVDSMGEARVDSIQEATDSIQQRMEKTFEKTDSANQVIADTAFQR